MIGVFVEGYRRFGSLDLLILWIPVKNTALEILKFLLTKGCIRDLALVFRLSLVLRKPLQQPWKYRVDTKHGLKA